MSELYPIIRRVRRPLVLPVERQQDAKPEVVPVKPKAEPLFSPRQTKEVVSQDPVLIITAESQTYLPVCRDAED